MRMKRSMEQRTVSSCSSHRFGSVRRVTLRMSSLFMAMSRANVESGWASQYCSRVCKSQSRQ